MNWDAIAAVAQLLGSLGVIATLAYLAVQIRLNNAESFHAATAELTRILATDREANRVFWEGLNHRSSLTDLDRHQFDALLTLNLQAVRTLFDQGQREQNQGINWLSRYPGFRDYWATNGPSFLDGSFRDYVTRQIKEQPLATQQTSG